MGTLYDAPHPLGMSTSRPGSLRQVGLLLSDIERWGNQIPFLEMAVTELPVQQSVTATTFGDVTGFRASVTPTRAGQLIIALVTMRCSRFAGGATLHFQPTLQIGSAAPVVLAGDWYLSATLSQELGLIPIVANSTRTHIIQMQAENTGGATTWLVRAAVSNITIITI